MRLRKNDIAEMIECHIIAHRLQPGDKLVSERDLCEAFGASRTLVRAAINQLQQEGVLYKKPGSGTFIKKPKICRPLQNYIPFKSTVENEGHTFSTRVLSLEKLESNKNIARRLHITLGHPVYAIARLRSIGQEPFMLDISYVDASRFKNLDRCDFSHQSLYRVLEGDYGAKIWDGREKISITFASEYEAAALQVAEGEALFYISSLARGENGQPLEYAKVVVRKDLVMFSCDLKN